MVGAWLTLSVVGPIVVLFVVFRSPLDPWLCSITEVLVICVSLWCFTDEVRDPMQAEHIFVIWRCNRIQSKIARVNPISSSLATVPRQCLYCSNSLCVGRFIPGVCFPIPRIPFSWVFGKAVLRDCGIPWVHVSVIFYFYASFERYSRHLELYDINIVLAYINVNCISSWIIT